MKNWSHFNKPLNGKMRGEQIRGKKRLIGCLIVLFILVIVLFLYILFHQKPLMMDGFTEYNNGRKKIDISLLNRGIADVYLRSIRINDNETPADKKLVVSYDGQLVAGGIDRNELAKFVEIDEIPIHPALSADEIRKALETNDRPIHYGIRLVSEEEIETILIRYSYLGIGFTKRINLDSWQESNY